MHKISEINHSVHDKFFSFQTLKYLYYKVATIKPFYFIFLIKLIRVFKICCYFHCHWKIESRDDKLCIMPDFQFSNWVYSNSSIVNAFNLSSCLLLLCYVSSVAGFEKAKKTNCLHGNMGLQLYLFKKSDWNLLISNGVWVPITVERSHINFRRWKLELYVFV